MTITTPTIATLKAIAAYRQWLENHAFGTGYVKVLEGLCQKGQ